MTTLLFAFAVFVFFGLWAIERRLRQLGRVLEEAQGELKAVGREEAPALPGPPLRLLEDEPQP